MNFPAALNAHYPPVLLCNSCCNIYFQHYIHSSSSYSSPVVTNGNHFRRRFRSLNPQEKLVSRHSFSSSREGIARCATSSETETEPESNNGKGKELYEDGGAQLSSDPLTQNNVHLDQPITDQGKELSVDGDTQLSSDPLTQNNGHLDQPITDQSKDQYADIEILNVRDSTEKIDGDLKAQGDIGEKDGTMEVTSGSPLPGLKQTGELIKIPKASTDILKDQVFGFDTFFVTSQEPYEGGILFKGNLRGQAAKSYEKIKKRMEDKFGDQYKLFLLINPEDDKPVAVVVPKQTLQPEATAVPEWFAAGSFGLVTIFTLLLRNVPALQSNLLSTFDNLEMLKVGLPGALITAIVLGAHEVSHLLVSKSIGAKLGVPYFVPSWQIGSFGAITRIISIISNREDLLKLAAAGPLAGFTVGLVLLLLGFIFPPGDGIGIIVDASVFHESFLAGGIAKLLLGDALKEGSPLSLNPLVIWAWAGLLINAINSIPAGELDGGRISFALWGRKAWARITGVSIALLGISSLFNDVAFYWVILVFFLQRGPIAPLSEEITDPESKYVALGITVLLLGLLVCLPYPFPFTTESILLD